jgi:hypothetical protein
MAIWKCELDWKTEAERWEMSRPHSAIGWAGMGDDSGWAVSDKKLVSSLLSFSCNWVNSCRFRAEVGLEVSIEVWSRVKGSAGGSACRFRFTRTDLSRNSDQLVMKQFHQCFLWKLHPLAYLYPSWPVRPLLPTCCPLLSVKSSGLVCQRS